MSRWYYALCLGAGVVATILSAVIPQLCARWGRDSQDGFGYAQKIEYIDTGNYGSIDVKLESCGGWPVLCACGVFRYSFYVTGPRPIVEVERRGFLGELTMETRSDFVGIGYAPRWAGAIVNFLFYSSFAAIGLTTYHVGVRYSRRWRGKCVRCGYCIQHSPTNICSECGTVRS